MAYARGKSALAGKKSKTKSVNKRPKRLYANVKPINHCVLQGTIYNPEYRRSPGRNTPVWSAKMVIGRREDGETTTVWLKAFNGLAKELKAIEEEEPLCVRCRYNSYKTSEGNFWNQFIIEEVLDLDEEEDIEEDEEYEEDEEDEDEE